MPRLPEIPARLRTLDELIRGDHYYLEADDDCFFIWEWDGAPYAESAVTNLIGNLQREERFRGTGAWHYRDIAVNHAADALGATIPARWRTSATFVPVPPSKIKGDARHSTRLRTMLRRVSPPLADIREMVLQVKNTQSREKNIPPEERAENWCVDRGLLRPKPARLIVIDDLLTGGSHFAGMKIILGRHFPDVPVSGVFLARRLLADPLLGANV